MACSNAHVPSITPGARNAAVGPRFWRMGTTIACTLAQRYIAFAGSITGYVQPPVPRPMTAEPSTAVSVPSAEAPSRKVMSTAVR